MGGFGSGASPSKRLVTECCIFSVKAILMAEKQTMPWLEAKDNITWTSGNGLTIRLDFRANADQVHLTTTRNAVSWTQVVTFSRTRAYLGGHHRWFTCPSCPRRCGRLYLPACGTQWKCRTCYDLLYPSSRKSHCFDRAYAMLAQRVGCSVDQVKWALKQIYGR